MRRCYIPPAPPFSILRYRLKMAQPPPLFALGGYLGFLMCQSTHHLNRRSDHSKQTTRQFDWLSDHLKHLRRVPHMPTKVLASTTICDVVSTLGDGERCGLAPGGSAPRSVSASAMSRASVGTIGSRCSCWYRRLASTENGNQSPTSAECPASAYHRKAGYISEGLVRFRI